MKKRPKSKHLVHLQKKIAGLNESALQRFVERARKAVGLRGTVNVLVTSSAAIRSLNRRFRSQNKATDVLSFPYHSSGSECAKRPKTGWRHCHLGRTLPAKTQRVSAILAALGDENPGAARNSASGGL